MQIVRCLGLMVIVGVVTACGNDTENDVAEIAQPLLDSGAGRLAILTGDEVRPSLQLYDLGQNGMVFTTQLSHMPSALYSSPSHGYAVLMDKNQGQVSFLATGVVPSLLNYHLYGATPAHYRQLNDQAAIFYDGNTEQSSKFDVFRDVDIAQQTVMSQVLPYKHHGVAEPRRNMVLSSFLPEGSNQLSMVKSYAQHGNHYHEEQTLNTPCNRLHGAASNHNFTGFGCEDGVLLVEQKGNLFYDTKLSTHARISTLIGHEKVSDLVALASTQNELLIVDTKAKDVHTVEWAEPHVKRLKQNFSTTGAYFVILDDRGTLHILNSQTWQVLHKVMLFNPDSDAIATAQLAMHGQFDQLFMNDTEQNRILQIDLGSGKIQQTIQLNIIPKQLTWLKTA